MAFDKLKAALQMFPGSSPQQAVELFDSATEAFRGLSAARHGLKCGRPYMKFEEPIELALCEEIAKTGVYARRQVQTPFGRCDVLYGNYAIEVKAFSDIGSCYKAIGQSLMYASYFRKSPAVCLPAGIGTDVLAACYEGQIAVILWGEDEDGFTFWNIPGEDGLSLLEEGPTTRIDEDGNRIWATRVYWADEDYALNIENLKRIGKISQRKLMYLRWEQRQRYPDNCDGDASAKAEA